jgi:hypothetical protein
MLRALSFVLFVLFAVAACSGQGDITVSAVGDGKFGSHCQTGADCMTGVCVRVDDHQGICSRDCLGSDACPASPNWACVEASGGSSVCACRPAPADRCAPGWDNDCNGKVDDCRQCGGELVPKNDPENCGACGKVCRDDQVCTDGGCACREKGWLDCGGRCIDPKSDAANCGACDQRCGSEQRCTDGKCECSIATRADECGTECFDFATDAKNCGSCKTACPTGKSCEGGRCACTPSAPEFCPGAGCRNITSDAAHCGACGKACPTGAACQGSQCACPGSKPTVCNGACVNTTSDPNNCGVCGNACLSGQYCSSGKCTCYGTGYALCGDRCISTATEPQNCGTCGHRCRQGETCSSGTCVCASGLICNDVCVPVNDAANCGACGSACGSGQYCSSGKCYCSSGQTACGTTCIDTLRDRLNCGTCGHACRNGESCSYGTCTCPIGKTYCAEAGACVDLRGDASHCGTCGHACAPTQTCYASTCSCPVGGQLFCSSQNKCTDVQSNNLHCGTCDHACPAATECRSATCTCTEAGRTLCGDACLDLNADNGHCGSCTTACDAGLSCQTGKCRCPSPSLAGEFRLTTTSSAKPAVAWNGTHLGVAYYDGLVDGSFPPAGNVKFALLNPDGTRALAQDLALTSYPVNGINKVITNPDITWNGSEWAIVWTARTSRSGGSSLFSDTFVQRLAEDGTPLAAAVNVTMLTGGIDGQHAKSIAFSAAGGSYAVASYALYGYAIEFQRLGPTAAAPEPINRIPVSINSYPGSQLRPALAVSASGTWGILGNDNGLTHFVELNADGSRTMTPVAVDTSAGAGDPDLAFDGTTWVGAWASARSGPSVVVARGNALETRLVVPSSDAASSARLAIVGNSVVVGWQRSEAAKAWSLKFARYRLPPATGQALVPLSDMASLTDAGTVGPDGNAFTMAAPSTNGFITLWTDTRWGPANLYGRTADVRLCQ